MLIGPDILSPPTRLATTDLYKIRHTNYRVAASIGYYQLLPDIIGYFQYIFKIDELLGGKNVWK